VPGYLVPLAVRGPTKLDAALEKPATDPKRSWERVSVTLAVTWTGQTISYEFVKRSVGGAISVTKSRKSFLLESGANVILRGCSRAVHA